MSENIIAAIIGLVGALIGGLIGGLIGYLSTMRATNKQLKQMRTLADSDRRRREEEREEDRRERRREREEDRRRRGGYEISSVMSDLLTESKVEHIKAKPQRLTELEHEVESLGKNFLMQNEPECGRRILNIGRNYVEVIRKYVAGEVSSSEVNRCRIDTRDEVQQIISEFVRF